MGRNLISLKGRVIFGVVEGFKKTVKCSPAIVSKLLEGRVGAEKSEVLEVTLTAVAERAEEAHAVDLLVRRVEGL